MSELEALIERERIIETINTLFIATDARDWAEPCGPAWPQKCCST